jgi:hypothetical protein
VIRNVSRADALDLSNSWVPGGIMARYSKSAGKDVKRAMHRKKKGKLKRGKGGKGGTVKSRKQAIAIGLSEARKKGKKVPKKKKKSRKKKKH